MTCAHVTTKCFGDVHDVEDKKYCYFHCTSQKCVEKHCKKLYCISDELCPDKSCRECCTISNHGHCIAPFCKITPHTQDKCALHCTVKGHNHCIYNTCDVTYDKGECPKH